MTRFTTPDGEIVDIITLSLTSKDDGSAHRSQMPHNGQQFRIRHSNGMLIGYARTVGELADFGIDVSSLTEEGKNS